MHAVQWFCILFERIIITKIESNSLRGQLYILDVFVNRQLCIKLLIDESDVTCLDQLRSTRKVNTNLCTSLELGRIENIQIFTSWWTSNYIFPYICYHKKKKSFNFGFWDLGRQLVGLFITSSIQSYVCIENYYRTVAWKFKWRKMEMV